MIAVTLRYLQGGQFVAYHIYLHVSVLFADHRYGRSLTARLAKEDGRQPSAALAVASKSLAPGGGQSWGRDG